jgi:hypothetical protein
MVENLPVSPLPQTDKLITSHYQNNYLEHPLNERAYIYEKQ